MFLQRFSNKTGRGGGGETGLLIQLLFCKCVYFFRVGRHLKDVRDRKILHTDFFKVQYIIIKAILSRKSMKKFTVTDEKYSVSI